MSEPQNPNQEDLLRKIHQQQIADAQYQAQRDLIDAQAGIGIGMALIYLTHHD